MSPTACPVHETLNSIKETLEDGRISHPRSIRLAEEIATLVRDIASGRAGTNHLTSLKEHVDDLSRHSDDPVGVQTAQWVSQQLDQHLETFQSHVKTHNCPSGDCDFLTPAPCQMACPAGIDVPTYVSLIGMGKDAEAIEVIRRDNPLPWVCGLVCTRPCEFMCVRARIDTAVSHQIPQSVCGGAGAFPGRIQESGKGGAQSSQSVYHRSRPGRIERGLLSRPSRLHGYGFRSPSQSRRHVARGDTAPYRLPADVIDREVDMIAELGVTFIFNTCFGKDIRHAGVAGRRL